MFAHLFGIGPDAFEDLTWPDWLLYRQYADAWIKGGGGRG